jgi:peroxiredoxin
MKRVFLFIVPLLLWGCQSRDTITIHGRYSGSKGDTTLYLKKIEVGAPQLIDSVTIRKNSSFKFKIKSAEPEFFTLGLGDQNYVTLVGKPGEKIHVRFPSMDLPRNYEVEGSKESSQVRQLDNRLRNTLRQMDSITGLYREKMNDPGFDTLDVLLNKAYDSLVAAQRKFTIDFILKNLNSFASIKALYQQYDDQSYVLNGFRDLQYMKLVSDTLHTYYPHSKHVQALATNLKEEMARYNLYRIQDMVQGSETNFFDITLPDMNGDTIALSSFVGDYIILSFWASWNEGSVNENKNLKSVYNKYKSEGLKVYQVSFDTNRETWQRAVRFDELPWINVLDRNYPNSELVGLYNIQQLPSNYLLDKDGSIIGKDLLGRSLRIKMEQLFGY